MDNYYVTPDGQIAKLPQRSFLDRLTSGLYDASVEYRKPGGGQEARLARTQPLTSALNQYGAQKREFDQQGGILERRQGFESEQSALDRAMREKLANEARELEKAKLAQDAAQFNATDSRLTLGQNLKGWDTARQFMMERPQIESQIEWNKARADAERAQMALYNAQAAAMDQKVAPELLSLLSAVNPKLTSAIQQNPGLTNVSVNALGKILGAREGTSGQVSPELIAQLLGGGAPAVSTPRPQLRGTNAPAFIDLNAP